MNDMIMNILMVENFINVFKLTQYNCLVRDFVILVGFLTCNAGSPNCCDTMFLGL